MKRYCRKLQNLLATDGPGSIRDDERAQKHVVDCTECFAFLETLGELEGHLDNLPLIDAPDEVVNALLARPEITEEEPASAGPARESLLDRLWPFFERNRRPGPLAWAAGASAALMLLVAFTVYLGGGKPFNDPRKSSEPAVFVRKYIPPPSDTPLPRSEGRELQKRKLPVPDAQSTLDDDLAERLSALGYIGSQTPDREGYVEEVVVAEKPSVVDLEETRQSSKFSDEFIEDLPVQGRFYTNVLTEAPGVADADVEGRDLHGSRERDFKTIVGGISNSDPLSGEDKNLQADVIEEMEVVTAGEGVEFGRAQGGWANFTTEITTDAARRFLESRTSMQDLHFRDATGYWANTYVPGDPGMRLLRWRLGQVERSTILPAVGPDTLLHDAARRPVQPFDPPRDSALSVYLHADRASLDEPGRMLLQVGLQGALRHGGRRPAMNLGVVLDLRGETPVNVAAGVRALLDALNEVSQPGDRFRVIVAGRPGATVVEPGDFRHGFLTVTLERLFDEESQLEGPTLDLAGATATAIRDIAGADDPATPLGTSAVLLVTHQAFGDATATLADMAHQSAVAGVPVSVVGIGDGARLDEIDRVTLAGQGNRRLLGSAAEAAGLIDRELAAVSRVIARAVRLRIRLAPGVQLVDVVGSTRLDEIASQRVREGERSVDLRLARNLGIEADRGEDEEGIQIVIPNFYSADTHFILLDVVADSPGAVADVTARYKDLVFLRNGVSRANLTLPVGEETAGPLELGVLRSYLAHRLHETLDEAGVALAAGDQAGAANQLSQFRDLLDGLRGVVPGFERDPDLARDIAMLDEYREILGGAELVQIAQVAYLSDSLRYAARLKVLPPYTVD